jgi:L-cystine uptake protein TcyP (sodium:dicarboxylate symporter family)
MFELYDVVIIPLIMGIVEVFKRAGVSKKLLPFIALVIGIAIGVVYVTNFDWKQGVLVGAMLGLSASGLYSSSKNTFEKNDE